MLCFISNGSFNYIAAFNNARAMSKQCCMLSYVV